jgi:hypothetical protein
VAYLLNATALSRFSTDPLRFVLNRGPAATVLALGRHDPVADDGAADADLGVLGVKLEVQALEGDRLADPQASGGQELE